MIVASRLQTTQYSEAEGECQMSDEPETDSKPKFDPVKLEQLNVARDYPMEEDE